MSKLTLPVFYLSWTLNSDQQALTARALRFHRAFLGGQLTFENLPELLQSQPELQLNKTRLALHELKGLLFPPDNPFQDDKMLVETVGKINGLVVSFEREYPAGAYVQMPLTETQMRSVADALEAYSRFLAGQLHYLDMPMELRDRVIEQEDKIKYLLPRLSAVLFPDLSPGEQRGIQWSPNPINQEVVRSYELYKTLLKFDMNHRGVSNTHSGSILHQSDWPLASTQAWTS